MTASRPTHTAFVDMVLTWDGDSVEAMAFRIKYPDGEPMIPVSVLAQIFTSTGRVNWTYDDVDIDPVTGRVTLPPIVGNNGKTVMVGAHSYRVRYTLDTGFQRTYFKGKVIRKGVIPSCP